MKKKRRNKIDWGSKFLDLLIVIIGISIAFQLNNSSESNKQKEEAKEYLLHFKEETAENQKSLKEALAFTQSNKTQNDTLKAILLRADYSDERIGGLITSLVSMSNFNPNQNTMQNITASGQFKLIRNYKLRKRILNTYNGFKNTAKLEELNVNYINNYITPFFFENVRFSNFTSVDSSFSQKPAFENIVFGYSVLLDQLINGYEKNLTQLAELAEALDE